MVTVTCTQVCMETYTHNERWGGGEILVDTHTKLTRVGDKDR